MATTPSSPTALPRLAGVSSAAKNVIRPCGSSLTECGYCRGKRAEVLESRKDSSRNSTDSANARLSSKAYGMLADTLSSQDYEALINRGWRRSGIHIYKPDNWNSCCPALAIRLPVRDFRMTKSQRKVWNSMHRLIAINAGQTRKRPTTSSSRQQQQQMLQSSGLLDSLEAWTHQALEELQRDPGTSLGQGQLQKIPRVVYKLHSQARHDVVLTTSVCAAIAGPSNGKISREQLSAQVLERLKQHPLPDPRLTSVGRHADSGQIVVHLQPFSDSAEHAKEDAMDISIHSGNGKSIADKFKDWWKETYPSRDMPTQNPLLRVTTMSALESALDPEVHRLYFMYQHKVHQDPDPFAQTAQATATQDFSIQEYEWGAHVSNEWVQRARHMLQTEYSSFHNKKAIWDAFHGFFQFLVEAPFSEKPAVTQHQHYRLGNQLIAVGVIDVLPTGLSSVYLFYHPSFSHQLVALGKYAILKEIEYTRDTLKLPFYYLGYYIESCAKMRYKADYRPSQLLCPKVYQWVDANRAQDIIRRFSPQRHCCQIAMRDNAATMPTTVDAAVVEDVELESIELDVGAGIPVTLNMLQPQGQEIVLPLLEELAREAGAEICSKCVIKLA